MDRFLWIVLWGTVATSAVGGFVNSIRINQIADQAKDARTTAAQHPQGGQLPICDTTRIPSYRDGEIVGYSINITCETSPGAFSTCARFQKKVE